MRRGPLFIGQMWSLGLAVGESLGTASWDWVVPTQGGAPLGLGLVPFLGPNLGWDNGLLGTVPTQVGTAWPCPNFACAS